MNRITVKTLIFLSFVLISITSLIATHTQPVIQLTNLHLTQSELFTRNIHVDYFLLCITVLSIVSGVIAWLKSPSKNEISKKITVEADYILSFEKENINRINKDLNFKVTEIKRMIIEATFQLR